MWGKKSDRQDECVWPVEKVWTSVTKLKKKCHCVLKRRDYLNLKEIRLIFKGNELNNDFLCSSAAHPVAAEIQEMTDVFRE